MKMKLPSNERHIMRAVVPIALVGAAALSGCASGIPRGLAQASPVPCRSIDVTATPKVSHDTNKAGMDMQHLGAWLVGEAGQECSRGVAAQVRQLGNAALLTWQRNRNEYTMDVTVATNASGALEAGNVTRFVVRDGQPGDTPTQAKNPATLTEFEADFTNGRWHVETIADGARHDFYDDRPVDQAGIKNALSMVHDELVTMMAGAGGPAVPLLVN
jgi:hypothetical protein